MEGQRIWGKVLRTVDAHSRIGVKVAAQLFCGQVVPIPYRSKFKTMAFCEGEMQRGERARCNAASAQDVCGSTTHLAKGGLRRSPPVGYPGCRDAVRDPKAKALWITPLSRQRLAVGSRAKETSLSLATHRPRPVAPLDPRAGLGDSLSTCTELWAKAVVERLRVPYDRTLVDWRLPA